AGVNVTLVPPRMVATPLVAATLTIVNGSPSGSLSFPRGSKVTDAFFPVETTSLTATGGRLVTLTVINAGAVPLFPSLIVYPTVALPVKLLAGVNVTFVPPRIVATPFVAATLTMVNGSPSGSLSFPRGSKVIGRFLAVETTSLTATGGRLVTF